MPNEEPELMKLLRKDIVLRIKFYVLFFGALLLFLLVCFLLQPQTYGWF